MTLLLNGTTGVADVDGSASTPAIRGTDTNTGIFFPAADTIAFSEGGAEVARFDSSGNLGIGTNSPTTKLNVFGLSPSIYLQQDGGAAGNTQLRLNAAGGANTGSVRLLDKYIWASTSNGSQLNIGNDLTTPQMTIGSNGITNLTVTNDDGLQVRSTASAGTTWANFVGRHSTSSFSFIVYNNGNVVNSNNSYGAFSDIKLKENIADATPKLEKLNQVRVVNYNIKGETQKQIGVIAQELEQIFPSMIDESPDRDSEGNDLGTTTKQVKYSVFVPMLIKAIQEQQAIITDLKSRIEALEQA
jgi:hypothetical protein